MKLTVKNLGPITKGGTIDLDKRFYVFVGKNGSGKTYLANLLYGVAGGYLRSGWHFYNEIEEVIIKDDNFWNNLFPTINAPNNTLNITSELWGKITTRFNDAILATFKNLLGSKNSLFEKTEIQMLGINYENFFLKDWRQFTSELQENIILYCVKEKNSSEVKIFSEPSSLSKLEFLLPSKSAHWGSIENIGELVKRCMISFIRYNNPIHRGDVFFLPANRSFFLDYWKYIFTVANEEKERILKLANNHNGLSSENLVQFKAPYTNSIKNLIDRIERLDKVPLAVNETYTDLVQELEFLMEGKILIKEGKEGIGRKRFTFEMQENGEEIELFLASSSVNQLSTFYIYLKYWVADKNNTLIIDEPEINLHPENQIKLLNILMKFADRNDNRVLITTHSTLMADAVNNHVRIGHLQNSERGKEWLKDNAEWLKENQLGIHENIGYDDFGVYYFDGAIKNYEVKDYGVFFKDFAEAEDKIKDVADILKGEIYKDLHPKKAK